MKRAIIYVRGHKKEMQEIICRLYAAEIGCKVLFVTTDIESVNNCDVLLVSSHSRISRKQHEYLQIERSLKEKGIQIISVSSQDNADECISMAIDLFR